MTDRALKSFSPNVWESISARQTVSALQIGDVVHWRGSNGPNDYGVGIFLAFIQEGGKRSSSSYEWGLSKRDAVLVAIIGKGIDRMFHPLSGCGEYVQSPDSIVTRVLNS